jgi:hypothetical protein
VSSTKGRKTSQSLNLTQIWKAICKNHNAWHSGQSLRTYYPTDIGEVSLLDVQEAGLQLQRVLVNAVTESLAESEELKEIATYLESLAELTTPHRNALIERIAAAYHLWPYYAAKYYGALRADNPERIDSRTELCLLQKLLFENVRSTLDYLRLSFEVHSDADLSRYVCGDMRKQWRDMYLTARDRFPDLCAVDSLVEDMVRMEEATPELHRATYKIHQIAMGDYTDKDREISSLALRRLGIAQLTVFHDPEWHIHKSNPSLIELVYSAPDELKPKLRELVPFHVLSPDGFLEERDVDADAFRLLANAIFSSDEKDRIAFHQQREAVLTDFVIFSVTSSGKTSEQFVRASPGFERKLWPAWYKRTLEDLRDKPASEIQDWSSEEFWWDGSFFNNGNQLIDLLIGRPREIHANHHAASLRDYLVHKEKKIYDSWDDLADWMKAAKPKAEAQTGFLLETLLRRNEQLTRTSFFFGVNKRFEKNRSEGRLYQFVGGTFLGLERPGIPFAPGRFREIANRIRGTVLALADCCTAMVQHNRLAQLNVRNERRKQILMLLEGVQDQGPPYALDDYHSVGSDAQAQEFSLVQRLQEIIIATGTTDHAFAKSCVNYTLKTLFYMFFGSCASSIEELDQSWQKLESDEDGRPLSDKSARCEECLNLLFRALVVPPLNKDLPRIELLEPTKLPSRPGIRFFVALADFIHCVGSEYGSASTPSWIEQIVLKPGELSIVFSSNFPELLLDALCGSRQKEGSVIGELKKLKNCSVDVPSQIRDSRITKLLTSPKFHQHLRLSLAGNYMMLRWESEE